MDFTREPIIETIISPKDGNKLSLRNTKSSSGDEFLVDALEIVNFGNALFFRSLERPKAFLLPVGDYEIVEVKETKISLKNISFERSIKIGGGKEAPKEDASATESKKKSRRSRRRRGSEERKKEEEATTSEEEPVQPQETPTYQSLLPPPSTLISETIRRYKEVVQEEKTPLEEKEESAEAIEEAEVEQPVPLSPEIDNS